MSKNKLRKFEEIRQFANVTEFVPPLPEAFDFKGTWGEAVFGNDHPLHLELACGKGEYAIALGMMYPKQNFIGIDIKGSRIWNGAKKALQKGIENVHFLRMYIDHISEVFAEGEVNDIWITFPDPYLRESDEKKRLTSPKFLSLFRKIAKPETCIHLKTDDPTLYSYTLGVIEDEHLPLLKNIGNIYKSSEAAEELTSVQTFYEKKHLKADKSIRYICFRLFPD